MAKQPSGKGGGRFRLVVLDAELGDGGDFSQMAQAIQNALRPTPIIQQRIIAPQATAQGLPAPATEDAEEDFFSRVDRNPSPEDAVEFNSKKTREPRQKRVSSPQVVNDLELNGEPAWMVFAQDKAPSSILDKYLVVAEWCRFARGVKEITEDHVFTCFKRINWSTNISDFSSSLRKLKGMGLMGHGSQRGSYEINHLGSSRVDDMNKKPE